MIELALIKISQKDLCKLAKIKPSEVEEILTDLGIPIEKVDADELSLEITPNRPDWLSVEGIARSCFSYKHKKPKKYVSKKSKINIIVNKSVEKIRPVIGSAYIKNITLTDEILESLIQLQEKLHDTLGRRRKKMAIGIHDASKITPPYTYTAVKKDSIKFVPLGMDSELTCRQILNKHEKGKKYAHLVSSDCPIIFDKNKQVLSFPPIINGELTKLTTNSKELLIDCTGTSEDVVRCTVNIISAALADRGAQIYSVKINGSTYPLFEDIKTTLSTKQVNDLLGQKLTKTQIASHLARLGHNLVKNKVHSPAFRIDILNQVDLIEDIAISIGYNKIVPTLPNFQSTSKIFSYAHIHEAAIGLGYFEVMGWVLTNHKVLQKSKIDLTNALRVKNPLTEEFTTLRPALYPNILEIFANSKSSVYPQKLYELGPIIKKSSNKFEQFQNFCMAIASPKASYSQIYSHLNSFLKSLNIKYSLKPEDIAGFIEGRCARIYFDDKPVGIIAEVHPEVLTNFSIEQPVSLFEIDATKLI